MLSRFKRAYKAFKNEQDILVVKKSSMTLEQANILSKTVGKVVVLTENTDDIKSVYQPESVGDGKAEFLGEGTEEEFIEQQRIDNGEDKWYKRIFRNE